MAGWGNDYIPSSRPVVAVPVRPKSSRLRHGSDATAFITQPAQAVMLDDNIQYLTPNAAQFQQRVQRASSVSGPRPTQIIIRNDNGASNSQSNEERPRSAHGHRHRPSSTHYHYEGERIRRSSSRQRRRYDDSYDEDDYYESDEYDRRGGRRVRIIEERRVRGHSRNRHRRSSSDRSSGSSKERKQHKRSPEDEAMIKQLDEYKKKEDEARAKKKYEDELLMKQLKEAQEKEERDKADKKVAAKAIEDFKLKQAEQDEKREKERREEEEKMVMMLMAGTPGLTEREARKFIRRAERNKDRAAHGELDDDDRNSGVSSAVGIGGVVVGGGNAITTVSKPRPTYIKVHMKHLSPETLDVYSIPWEWDTTDTNYIIIKQWISEPEQEILFEHTRQQKERQRLTYPRDKLRADANQIVILKDKKERKKSPIKKTSWFFT